MKILPPVVFATCAFASLTPLPIPLSSVKRETNLPFIQNKFIIEVQDAADLPATTKRSLSVHESLYAELEKRGISYDVNKEFNSAGIFVGAAVTLANSQDVKAVSQIQGVKAIRPVTKFNRPEPVKSNPATDPNDPALPDTESTHVLTGVDKLHAQGITGKGITVALIDTGVDYNHPALGSGFGPGKKIVGGYDLVGDDYDGTNEPAPDPDPLDTCGTSGHGTHTSGIVGADPNNPFNISGVAYDASLLMYRVFGCLGFVGDDVLIDGMLMAVKANPHIISMSIGSDGGWSESTLSVVASRIAAQGTIFTISAGNDGTDGPWEPGSPADGLDVISVASLENTAIPWQSVLVEGDSHPPIIYFSDTLSPLNITGTFPIYATSNSTTVIEDACKPLPDDTPDLSGFAVIIRRSSDSQTCGDSTSLQNVAAKGAKIAFIYNDGGVWRILDHSDIIPFSSLIQEEDGKYLVEQFAAGVPISLTFPPSGHIVEVPDPSGGLISGFTSMGPTFELRLKPALAAPGGNILSTIPVNMGSYAVFSGTSMAAPFVAGSAALLLGAKGISKQVALNARSVFQSTAKLISTNGTEGDPWHPAIQGGAGLINVLDAIQSTTVLTPTGLNLNDTVHFKAVHQLTVQNTGKASKDFTISHVPAATAQGAQQLVEGADDSWFPGTFTNVLISKDAAAQVTFSESSFTIPPGGSHTFTATFALPTTLNPLSLPLFTGFIQVDSGAERVHATYLGLAASLKDEPTLDTTSYVFGQPIPVLIDSQGKTQVDPTNYTFVGQDFPAFLWRERFGTAVFRIDLVDVNTTIAEGSTKTRRAPFLSFPKKSGPGTFQQVKTLGSLTFFEYLRRNTLDAFGNVASVLQLQTPTFANGTTIPNGQYRALIRSLRVTGDPNKEEDYDAWLGPIFGVNV